ncbi:MAG: phosphohydrolase [Betaproteobacteria bacterium HGW-Betaproteobacteria-5]|jgi:HD-GYP domain-containing protein (c-di-GMP phosphodiesterase class II)|nr:MAG: phosphohydrolase [Betaproteobacteria bacterium HGW-Betaproteobacteria-5]PKO39157.1 MAG: phosphohydrolase [Betaproteobacteria bacterium HGW-Betaproteobacteria-6]
MNLPKDIGYFFGSHEGRAIHYQEDLLSSLLVMAWMVEARDPYTGGHLWRVSRFSRLLASELNLPDESVARISLGSFLHDLGKVGVPDQILNKKDRLTDEEYEVIKTHPDVGWRMLAGHPLARLVESAIRAHHEMPDGRGYPRGLVGDEIPLDARIVGICDAFDAMTSARPYRRGMTVEKALSIIEENLGQQFDQAFGDRFVELGKSGALHHIVGHSDEGIPLQECMMCGPTLVMRRGQQVDDYVYCRSCTGEYKTELQDGKLVVKHTGKSGHPRALESEADTKLIGRLVHESARALLRV